MPFVPRSLVKKVAPRQGGFQPKPVRRRKPKPAIDISSLTEDQQAQLGLAAAARRMKAERASIYSQAKPATRAQIEYLSALLDTRRWGEIIRFVEFANQLPSSTGHQGRRKGKTFLSRIYWVRAIDMALNEQNAFCTAVDEIAISFGYRDNIDLLKSIVQPSFL